MLSKEEIKEALYECKDEVVIGLWNQCAEANRYETVYINDVVFFFDHIVRGGNHCEFAEAAYGGNYSTKDRYAWFNSNHALMSFNRPCDQSSPVDYDILACFVRDNYEVEMPSDVFDIEL